MVIFAAGILFCYTDKWLCCCSVPCIYVWVSGTFSSCDYNAFQYFISLLQSILYAFLVSYLQMWGYLAFFFSLHLSSHNCQIVIIYFVYSCVMCISSLHANFLSILCLCDVSHMHLIYPVIWFYNLILKHVPYYYI